MRLIDADTAQPGLTIVTDEQTTGKGQRGRKWVDAHGQSLLMSLVIVPELEIEQQFTFNILISLAIADYLQEIYENWDIRIKWPNDIIINDKKAGGILIENVIRGNSWAYSVVGTGINILQYSMPAELPYATSLRIESDKQLVISHVVTKLRQRIFTYLYSQYDAGQILRRYNDALFRKDMPQHFKLGGTEFTAIVHGVTIDGMLQLLLPNGDIANYNHGAVEWMWG